MEASLGGDKERVSQRGKRNTQRADGSDSKEEGVSGKRRGVSVASDAVERNWRSIQGF